MVIVSANGLSDGVSLLKSGIVIESGQLRTGKGLEIQVKNPLRINEHSYIITVCYPAKFPRDGFVCIHDSQTLGQE